MTPAGKVIATTIAFIYIVSKILLNGIKAGTTNNRLDTLKSMLDMSGLIITMLVLGNI